MYYQERFVKYFEEGGVKELLSRKWYELEQSIENDLGLLG